MWVQAMTKTVSFLHTFVAIAACIVVGYVASLCCGGRGKKDLRALTMWDLAK